MPAFLLASADSSVFLAMSSSTVLYLPLSSLFRTCPEFKHKVELMWSQYCGIWLLLPLPFTNPAATAGSSLNKSRSSVRIFPTSRPRLRAVVKTHQLPFCRSVADYSFNTGTWQRLKEAMAPRTAGKLHMALLLDEWLHLGRNTLATLSATRILTNCPAGVGEGTGKVKRLVSQLCFFLWG